MEPASLVIGAAGLAALFNDALDCFEFVQLGRKFGKDFGTSQLKLDNARLRLSRWGEAVAIHKNADDFPPRELKQARKSIGQILYLFAEAEGVSKRAAGTEASDAALTVYDPDTDMGAKMRALHEQMRSLALARQKRAGLSQKTKWALYEKGRFKELVEDINDLVDDLEKIFPARQEARRKLCEDEVAAMEGKAELPLLRDVAAGQDPSLLEAVKKALGEKDDRLLRVEFSGHNNHGFQLGNNSGTISGFIFGGKN